jgi:hypothetical protein
MVRTLAASPPAVRAVLWMDAAVLLGVAFAFARTPALAQAGAWTWVALIGSTLTAVLGALAAFELAAPGRGYAWVLLPTPAFLLWIAASGLGCVGATEEDEAWGRTLGEASECFVFLLTVSAPLLAAMFGLLWWAGPALPWRALAMGAVASAGAAATLLTLWHPHQATFLDLGAHAAALAAVLGIAALIARIRAKR